MGEAYDARLEMPGWNRARFDDRAWANAIPAAANGSTKAKFFDGGGSREVELGFVRPARLQAYPGPPVRAIQEIKPVGISSPAPGKWIFNLGQNFAGTVRLKVKAPAGTRLQLRYGEMVHPDGRLMTENLRKARATDFYTCSGQAQGETWTPAFTFHGFQYVELTGLPTQPGLDAITGLVLHSDTPLASNFECSDPMVNRLFHNIVWTQRANFLELPTDCPQRDERLGWMGDAQIYARTATWNADVAAFYSKWLTEVVEAQLPSGAYPDYAPWPFQHGKAYATAWTDAGIIVPHTVWQVYGDTRLLERMWPSMTRFMDWRQKVSPDRRGRKLADANTWGDWLNVKEQTPLEFIDAAYFKWDAGLMARMARALGRSEDATMYARLEQEVARQFALDYLLGNGLLKVDTQTAYALAISFGLLPEAEVPAAARRLAEKIAQNGYRMATGFLGTKPLLPALTAGGQHDLAARLLQSRKFPSWGFEVENGATTIWERWDSFTRDHGFNGAGGDQNAAMNSFAHYSFGAVCEWMFNSLAGMETDGPGFQRLVIRPRPPTPGSNPDQPPIFWVKASYQSPNGPVRTEWRRDGRRFELLVVVPPNVQALIHLPASAQAVITEGGQALEQSVGLRLVSRGAGEAVLEVGSGRYRFMVSDLP
jgi:alpha-L-rhamnosidase